MVLLLGLEKMGDGQEDVDHQDVGQTRAVELFVFELLLPWGKKIAVADVPL